MSPSRSHSLEDHHQPELGFDAEHEQHRNRTQLVPQMNCVKRQEVLQVVPPVQKIPLVQSDDVAVHVVVLGKQRSESLRCRCERDCEIDSPRDPKEQMSACLQEVEEVDHVDQEDGLLICHASSSLISAAPVSSKSVSNNSSEW